MDAIFADLVNVSVPHHVDDCSQTGQPWQREADYTYF